MADYSAIEWTEATWNPVTGCTKVSAGCRNCYAERMALRLQSMGQSNYVHGFQVTMHEHMLERPLSWKKPRIIFTNSMSDLFHEDVPDDFIHDVFNVMKKACQHIFQILTKRSERLVSLADSLDWPPNVWMGVTVENAHHTSRINDLCQTGAAIKFLSLEPLLGPLARLDLSGINWVIVGGESGPFARPVQEAWIKTIRDQCILNDVPFFFKQWGGTKKKQTGRLLDGITWSQLPLISPSSPRQPSPSKNPVTPY